MDVKISKNDTTLTVVVTGNLNTQTAPSLENNLIKELNETIHEVVFDFSNLEYISSAGLRVLLVTTKKIKDGKVTIKNAKEDIIEIFNMTGFNAFLNIE